MVAGLTSFSFVEPGAAAAVTLSLREIDVVKAYGYINENFWKVNPSTSNTFPEESLQRRLVDLCSPGRPLGSFKGYATPRIFLHLLYFC